MEDYRIYSMLYNIYIFLPFTAFCELMIQVFSHCCRIFGLISFDIGVGIFGVGSHSGVL